MALRLIATRPLQDPSPRLGQCGPTMDQTGLPGFCGNSKHNLYTSFPASDSCAQKILEAQRPFEMVAPQLLPVSPCSRTPHPQGGFGRPQIRAPRPLRQLKAPSAHIIPSHREKLARQNSPQGRCVERRNGCSVVATQPLQGPLV